MTTLLDTTIKEPCRIVIEQDGDRIISEIIPIKEEKFEPKDGDAVSHDFPSGTTTGILKGNLTVGDNGFPVYAGLDSKRILFLADYFGNWDQDGEINRLATEEEKQRLFDALERAGKRWNAEKKRIEDIPKEPKVGDWCLFWDNDPRYTVPGMLKEIIPVGEWKYYTDTAFWYKNAVIWDKTFEHFERVMRGEI